MLIRLIHAVSSVSTNYDWWSNFALLFDPFTCIIQGCFTWYFPVASQSVPKIWVKSFGMKPSNMHTVLLCFALLWFKYHFIIPVVSCDIITHSVQGYFSGTEAIPWLGCCCMMKLTHKWQIKVCLYRMSQSYWNNSTWWHPTVMYANRRL